MERSQPLRRLLQCMLATGALLCHTLTHAEDPSPHMTSWSEVSLHDTAAVAAGRQAVQRGQVAVVLLAGGQGSRLGQPIPKGCFEITPIRHATLFQCLAERLLVAEQQLKGSAPLCIWTNVEHESEVRKFWEDHHNFGLPSAQIVFVVQPERPLLNDQMDPIQLPDGRILTGPDGNGSLWRHLEATGTLVRWEQQGVRMIHVVPVDNPFAEPLELAAIGAIAQGKYRAVLLSIKRQDPEERVGVILHDHQRIAEYTELPEEAKGEEGCRRYPQAFAGMQTWELAYARQSARRELPIHRARKKVTVAGHSIPIWKEEFFLFDLLVGEPQVAYMPVSREERFSPLKGLEGQDGVAQVQQALTRRAQEQAQRLGVTTPEKVLECSVASEWAAPGSPVQLSKEGLLEVVIPVGAVHKSMVAEEVL